MQWLLFLGLALVLSLIAWEDFRYRQVHVLWFVLLFVLAVVYAYQFLSWESVWNHSLVSLAFILLQALFLMGYFIIKHKRWINITEQYIGWGDILFLLAVIPLFHPVVYFLFYLVSIMLTILCVLVYRLINEVKDIPLAGIQALFLLALVYWHQVVNPLLFDHFLIEQF